jgi:hypothetical protein
MRYAAPAGHGSSEWGVACSGSVNYFVISEPFCGNSKPVERVRLSICHEKVRKNTKKKWRVGSNWWRG